MEYHSDRFEDASILIFKKGRLVALLPACQEDKRIYSHKGLTYGGVLVGSDLKFKSVLECVEEALKFYDNLGFQELEFKITPPIYNKYPSDELLYLMKILDATLIRRDMLSVVDLKQPLKYSKDRLDGIKRAQKAGLSIKANDSFDEFWESILIPNLQKKHGVNPVHSLEEIKLLKRRFPENIIQFNVYDGLKIVAGTTLFISDNVVHSQYISANEAKNITGSLDILHHVLLTEVFQEKQYFDFGISNENNGVNVNSGLQYWKEGFGARAIVQDFYKLSIADYYKLSTVLK